MIDVWESRPATYEELSEHKIYSIQGYLKEERKVQMRLKRGMTDTGTKETVQKG